MRLKQRGVCLRKLLIAFNIIFWFSGLGTLGLGIWLFLELDDLEAAIERAQLLLPAYLLVISGGAVVIIGIIGCMAIFGASRCLLGLYSTCVFLVCMANIGACIKTFLIYDEIVSLVTYRLNTTIRYKYNTDDDAAIATDHMQQKFKCCGVYGPGDWLDPDVYTRVHSLVSNGYHTYPNSCCQDTSKCNLKASNIDITADIFQKGCLDVIVDHMNLLLPLVGWSTFALAAFLIIGGAMICCYRVAQPD